MTGMRLSSSVRVLRQRAGTICQRTLRSSRWVMAACLCLGLASFRLLLAQDNPAGAGPVSKPTRRIDLSAVGYHQLSRTARLNDEASLSLDFVDADDVLLTFNQKKLFRRLSDCPPDHDDRLVRAVVLEVPSGEVVREADWYLHDRRRYLWSLGSGTFLLRKLNSLYIVDSTLRERLLMASPNDLLWVAVTPDKRQIIVETAEDTNTSHAKDSPSGPAREQKKAKPQFRLEFLDVDTLVSQRTIKLSEMVSLEGTSAGYADSLHKGDLWLIRFGPTPTERHNIARVRSRTVPRVFYSSNNSLLIGRCPAPGCDYSVTAFTVTGRRLWRQRWNQLRFFPAASGNADNSRVGVSTLKRAASSAPVDYDDEESHDAGAAQDGLEQNVRVIETASGTPVLSVDVSPAVQSGQNFSLSPDGRWLAVLQDSALELYELPQLSDEEKAQFSAVKADVPGLYMLSSKSEAESESEPEATTESVLQATRIAGNGVPGPAAAGQETPNPNEKAANDAGSVAPRPENQNRPSAPSVEAATTTSAEDTRESVTAFRVNTSAVLVDVVVTDAKGQAVKGLRQQDFQVMEDGKPQNVRSFREFNDADGAQIPHTPTAPAPPKPAPNVFTNNTDAPDRGAVTMILLDLLNTPLADQQYARQQLVKFLKAKARTSQIALCVLSSNQAASLRLIQGFTPDENVLLAAIAGKKGMPHMAAWQAAAAGTGNAVNAVAELAQGDPNSWQGLLHGLEQLQAEGQATDTDARAGSTIDALTQLARYLSGIPGRKNLVWLSGWFPLSMSPNAVADHPALDSRNYATAIKRVTNLLGEGQIAVYPVDVRGPLVGGVSAADNIGIAAGGGPIPSAPGQLSSRGDTAVSLNEASQQRMMQELTLRSAERSTMNQFAADTGGKAFFSANAVEDAIATATEQGSNYYTLSYSPANRNYNGRFRQIRVALAQRGYHLHYRQGYIAEDFSGPPKDGDASRNISTAAMQHGSPQSRQIHFAVQVVPMGAKKKVDSARAGELRLASRKKPSLPAMVEMQHYAIDYAVDSSDLRFLPLKNQIHHSMLNLMIADYSDDGSQLSGVSTVWTSDLSPTVYRDVINGGVRIHQEVDLPTEAVSLRLGLQDKVSNHLGTIELPLPLPAPPDVPRTVKHSLPEIEPD